LTELTSTISVSVSLPAQADSAERAISESTFIPERSTPEILTAIAVFGITVLYLLPFLRFTVFNADEGITLQGAQRILHGQVLYRDFFGFYTPGSYYWDALIMRIFGSSIGSMRLMLIMEGGALSTVTYLITRRTCSAAISFAVALLTSIASLPLSFYIQHSWDSSLLASITVYLSARLIERPRLSRSVVVGCMVCVTMLFEQSRGGGLLLGLALAFVLLQLKGTRFQFTWTIFLAMLVGFTMPLALTFLYFGVKGSALAMVKDWFWPLHHYSITNRLPYGYIPFAIGQYEELLTTAVPWRLFFVFVGSSLFLLCAMPIFGVGILPYLTSKFAQNRGKLAHLILVTCVILGLWLSVVAGRRDYQHFAYLFPLSSIFLAWILDGVIVPRSFRLLRTMLCGWSFSSLALVSFSMLLAANGAKEKIETRRGTLAASGTDNIIPYLQLHSKPEDKLFVYPYQPLYYFLTATTNPTSFDYIQPGLHSPDQIELAIRELDRNPNAAVLFSSSFAEIISIAWPSTPDKIIAAPDPMALFIVKHYRLCQSLTATTNGKWTWLYMVRMNKTCPL
jgi:hypothetical protein